jgi:hypothetical protein
MKQYNDQAQQELIAYLKSLSPEGFEKFKAQFTSSNVDSSVDLGDPIQSSKKEDE